MALTAAQRKQRAADRALAASRRTEPRVARAFIEQVARAKGGATQTELARLIQGGNLEQALTVAERAWDAGAPAFRTGVAANLRDALEAGARASLTDAPMLVGGFDVTNPKAVEWAGSRAAALVTRVSSETRAAIRAAVAEAVGGGASPLALAKEIQGSIGLLPRQTAAVTRYRRSLERLQSAAPGTTRSTPLGPVSNKNLPDARVDRLVTSYRDRLLRTRAETIARTETLAAVNEGQRQLWAQAAQTGETGALVRHWLVTQDERLCDRCDALDGTTAEIGGTFPGEGKDGPPLHPNCRCTEVLGPP